MTRKLSTTLFAIAALTLMAPVAVADTGKGKGHQKSAEAKAKPKKEKKAKKAKNAQFKGVVTAVDAAAGTVTVKVDKASKHGRAFKGLDVVFTLESVRKLKVADTNGDGVKDINDVRVGDLAHAGARIAKDADVTAPVAANKFHAAAPEATETETETETEETPAPAPAP